MKKDIHMIKTLMAVCGLSMIASVAAYQAGKESVEKEEEEIRKYTKATISSSMEGILSREDIAKFQQYHALLGQVEYALRVQDMDFYDESVELLNEFYGNYVTENADYTEEQIRVDLVHEFSKRDQCVYVGIRVPNQEGEEDISYYPLDRLSVISTDEENYMVLDYSEDRGVACDDYNILTGNSVGKDLTDYSVMSVKDYVYKNNEVFPMQVLDCFTNDDADYIGILDAFRFKKGFIGTEYVFSDGFTGTSYYTGEDDEIVEHPVYQKKLTDSK